MASLTDQQISVIFDKIASLLLIIEAITVISLYLFGEVFAYRIRRKMQFLCVTKLVLVMWQEFVSCK